MTSEKLTIAELLLILAHRPDKPGYFNSQHVINIGLVGAILLDLTDENCLHLNNARIEIVKRKSELTPIHQQLLDYLANSTRKRKVKRWISRISNSAGKYRKAIIKQLEQKRFYQIEQKSFLGIKYINAQLLKTMERERLVQALRSVVFEQKKPDHQQVSLLSLIKACGIYKILCRDSKERKVCRKALKQIIKQNEIAGSVDKVLQEMHAAIIAATVATTAVTTTTASN